MSASELTDRELDALVAEKVMSGVLAPYSTSIEAAWTVVEKLKFIEVQILNLGIKSCDFSLSFNSIIGEYMWKVGWKNRHGYEVLETYATTAPRAICLAALKAVGVELPKESSVK